jgi:hypothetical protein
MEWFFVHDLEAKARIETLRAFIEILHLQADGPESVSICGLYCFT